MADFPKIVTNFEPGDALYVTMDKTGCYHVDWTEEDHRKVRDALGSTHSAVFRRAPAVVTDAMVDAGVSAWLDKASDFMRVRESVRAAIEAALAVVDPQA